MKDARTEYCKGNGKPNACRNAGRLGPGVGTSGLAKLKAVTKSQRLWSETETEKGIINFKVARVDS